MSSIQDPTGPSTVNRDRDERRPERTPSRFENEQAMPEHYPESSDIENFDSAPEDVQAATETNVSFTPPCLNAGATGTETDDSCVSSDSSTNGVQGSETDTETNDGSVLSDSPHEGLEATATMSRGWWEVYELDDEDADDTTTDPHPYYAELRTSRNAKLASKKKSSWRGAPAPGTNGRHERAKAEGSRGKRVHVCWGRGEEFLSWGF